MYLFTVPVRYPWNTEQNPITDCIEIMWCKETYYTYAKVTNLPKADIKLSVECSKRRIMHMKIWKRWC